MPGGSVDAGTRYTLHEKLGEGGFGEVWRATRTTPLGLEQTVAVKLLHGRPDSDALSRLKDEAQALALLHHPAILHVFDLVEIDGRLGLVTEFHRGVDVQRLLDRGPLPTRASLELIAELAEVVAVSWETVHPKRGPLRLLHRDLKPANIRLGEHGDVRLIDFGIVRFDSRQARTQTRGVVGSFEYMAPERFKGTAHLVASEVYSLGCVLYECLTAERLFAVGTPRRLGLVGDRKDHDRHIGAHLARVDADDDVVALVLYALAHDPDERPSPRALAHRCAEVAGTLGGSPLREWARHAVAAAMVKPEPAPPARPAETMDAGPTVSELVAPTAGLGSGTQDEAPSDLGFPFPGGARTPPAGREPTVPSPDAAVPRATPRTTTDGASRQRTLRRWMTLAAVALTLGAIAGAVVGGWLGGTEPAPTEDDPPAIADEGSEERGEPRPTAAPPADPTPAPPTGNVPADDAPEPAPQPPVIERPTPAPAPPRPPPAPAPEPQPEPVAPQTSEPAAPLRDGRLKDPWED